MEINKQNYTEKVTLRLTAQDKQDYQKEADTKKLPLTTLLRNKINGIEVQEVIFEPKLIHYDKTEHNRKQHLANLQLSKFEKIRLEASKHIDIPTSNEELTELLTNPYNYITSKIEANHRKDINIPISKEKLFELLEIDLNGLNALIKGYNSNMLMVDENQVKTRDFRDEFESFTSNEDENKRLEISLNLIESFNELTKDNTNYNKPHQLIQATSNLLRYNNGLIPSLRYVKQSRFL